ncbi:RNA-dependent DNA polymerase [Phytophthora cinnamomi]|uniref:RNA-dependent DNA polymerase n=1 Tax=Phytophthora cinnamomi TaxID=4785 RepID=UPI0035595487|nr:RNA-dependent DNA polymerase [Phytophthora cinnamomi]
MPPPVDYVEGFTGAVAKVLGVWRFRLCTQYEQIMTVDALIVEGASTEFLLGENWMLDKGVKIDFVACEMKWFEEDVK